MYLNATDSGGLEAERMQRFRQVAQAAAHSTEFRHAEFIKNMKFL